MIFEGKFGMDLDFDKNIQLTGDDQSNLQLPYSYLLFWFLFQKVPYSYIPGNHCIIDDAY